VPQGVEVQFLSRALRIEEAGQRPASSILDKCAITHIHGDYSLVVKLGFVEPVSRVRFSLVAPNDNRRKAVLSFGAVNHAVHLLPKPKPVYFQYEIIHQRI
jgi:hypothetical protein